MGVLQHHYLSNISSVDGSSAFLGMQPRTDLAESFRSATARWNPNLVQSLSEEQKRSVSQTENFVALSQKIDDIGTQIGSLACHNEDKVTRLMIENLQSKRISLYKERERMFTTKLKKVQTTQKISYSNKGNHSGEDIQQEFLKRIRHMFPPERIRLAAVMHERIRPRSPEWISALKDLVTLRNSDCSVAYQPGLRPKGGRCPYCKIEMKR